MNLVLGNLLRRRSKKNRHPLRERRLGLESLEDRCLLTAVTLTPVKDNSIYSGFPTNSNAKGLLYVGLNNDGNNIKRTLLDFNVAGSVPAGATINSVSLSMYSVRNSNGGNLTAELHKLSADWGEGTSLSGSLTKSGGKGTAATTNDATWTKAFFNTISWATQGGDFSPTISGSTMVTGNPNGLGYFTWTSTAQMVADVQGWLNNPSTDNGWLLKGSTADELVNSSHAFYPREGAVVAQRPTLTINYTAAATNLPPTVNAIADPAAINQNAGLQTVNLAGITSGAGETQTIQVTAASDNTALIPNPTVSYASPNATGSLTYQPVANQFGTAHVTVTVRDAGLDGVLGNTDDATFARTFTVLVNPVNQTPTLNAIADPAAINQNAGLQTVNLAGITAGAGETQTLQVTASSDNTALIPNPTVTYTSPNTTGSLTYQPVANQFGTAHVTVTVRDAGLDGTSGNADDATFARTFTVVVNQVQVNQPPTLNAISVPAMIGQNAGLQTVNLAGISAGTGESQALQVTASSDNTAVIPNPTVSYTSPSATGSLTYQPVANQTGTAHVTVTVRDAGPDGALGNTDDATFARTFTVVVSQGTVRTFAPVKDNTLIKDTSKTLGSTSNGTGALYTGQNADGSVTLRGLLAFDVAGIPAGATIQSVALTMFVTKTQVGNTAIGLYDVQTAWGEAGSFGNGAIGGLAATGDATWLNTFYNTQFWAVPGGDFAATASAVQTVGAAGVSYTWNSTAQMIADVQGWLDHPNTNDGWLLKGDETSPSSKEFASRESSNAAQRPALIISYTVNQPPTLNAIADPAAINQNAGLQTVNLAGITAGAGETQTLQVTAASDNTALIPNPTVSYTSPNATGSLTYQPAANRFGTAHVTVTVRDAGLDGLLGNTDDATFARTFTVAVNPVNQPPTLNAIADPAAINQNAGLQTVNLAGITAGAGETQTLQVTAASDNTALIPNPPVSYTSPNATGSLTYQPLANQFGTAHVTVTVRDAGRDGVLGNTDDATFARTFTVAVVGSQTVTADVAVTLRAPERVGRGKTLTYTIQVVNVGPQNAPGTLVTDVFPAGLSQVTWKAVASRGGTGAISGKGDLHETINLPVNGKMIYTVTAVVSANADTELKNTVGVSTAAGIRDPEDGNDRQTRTTKVVKQPWQNSRDREDVDDRHGVTPLDALMIINRLNANSGGTDLQDSPEEGAPYFDVNGDDQCTALDVLMVINRLNGDSSGAGQGMAATSLLAPLSPPVTVIVDAGVGPSANAADAPANGAATAVSGEDVRHAAWPARPSPANAGAEPTETAEAADWLAWQDGQSLEDPFDNAGVEAVLSEIGHDIATAWQTPYARVR